MKKAAQATKSVVQGAVQGAKNVVTGVKDAVIGAKDAGAGGKPKQRQQWKKEELKPVPKEQNLGSLDLLFIHDATASQEPYISETVKHCQEICHTLKRSGKLKEENGLRIGLVAYRDHPQDGIEDDFICTDFGGFTHDADKLLEDVQSLDADGGGDLAEAVADAFHSALSLDWRQDAAKVIVLLTDAAPHGIGEIEDEFPRGCPCGHDPLVLARKMAEKGIILLVVACEPSLSDDYYYAKDFFTALANITSGIMFPLTKTELLSTFILGSSLEAIGLELLVQELQGGILAGEKEGKSVEELTKEVYRKLKKRGEKITSIPSNSPYADVAEARHNVKVFFEAPDIASARKKLQQLPEGKSRFVESYDNSKDRSSRPPYKDPVEVEVMFKNLGDETVEIQFGEDVGSPNPRKLVVRPGWLIRHKFEINKPHNFLFNCGRRMATAGRFFAKAQDFDLWKFFA